LGEVLANYGKTQLRLAETEKYAHVTFFFNCGSEICHKKEVRKLIPSPSVATYDLKPEMSAAELTNQLIEAVKSNKYDFILCNFANTDMVGHTGDFCATMKAVECIDKSLKDIVNTIITCNGEALITADHGNAELMVNFKTNQPHKAHTCYPVPLVYISKKNRSKKIKSGGKLTDIAPTILSLMGIKIPEEMTGKTLV
jgi:2,3-bisphosphoglycerate-independent phosphoglycerate mutase